MSNILEGLFEFLPYLLRPTEGAAFGEEFLLLVGDGFEVAARGEGGQWVGCAREFLVAFLNSADTEHRGEQAVEQRAAPVFVGGCAEIGESLFGGAEVPEENDGAAHAREDGDAAVGFVARDDGAAVAFGEENFVGFVPCVVADGDFVDVGGVRVAAGGSKRQMFFVDEDAAIDGEAVTAAHGVGVVVDLVAPPTAVAEADGRGVGDGEFALEDVECAGSGEEDIVITQPADAAIARDGAQEFVTFGGGVEVEEFLDAHTGEFARVERSGAVEDGDVDGVAQVFAREVMPHGHHRREDVHREERGFVAWREGWTFEIVVQRWNARSQPRSDAKTFEDDGEEFVVGAGHDRIVLFFRFLVCSFVRKTVPGSE